MTSFEVGDLLRMPVQPGRYDLIMCRNTVIYFTEEVRDALHARLAAALAPGGYLVVGTSERVADPRALEPHLSVPLHLPEERVVMDISEYLPMFLAEGREHLQELNLAVVRIEERPDDQDTVDEIFRIAHSLKGMSATMGFAGMAALTHEMEDVFELLRQRKGGLPREAIDVLLECLDALSAAVDAIDESGEEEIEPKPLIDAPQGPHPRPRRRGARGQGDRRGAHRPRRAGRRPPRRPGQRDALRRRADPVGARVHGPLGARRARRDAGLRPDARRRRDLQRQRDRRLDGLRAHRLRAGRRGRRRVGRRPRRGLRGRQRRRRRDRRRGRRGRRPSRRPPPRRSRSPAVTTARAPRPSAWTPSGSTSSCTSWASSCCTAPRSRRSPPTPTCRASRRRCRT